MVASVDDGQFDGCELDGMGFLVEGGLDGIVCVDDDVCVVVVVVVDGLDFGKLSDGVTIPSETISGGTFIMLDVLLLDIFGGSGGD